MITGFLALKPPRMPARRWTAAGELLAMTGMLHLLALAALAGVPITRTPATNMTRRPPDVMHVVLPRTFFEPALLRGGGGGGGGNGQSGPIRRGEAIGRDTSTLRTTPRVAPAEQLLAARADVPGVVLDARPLSSGNAVQIGLPMGGASYGTSTGPGSGGGVGTGMGTGIGAGRGPGVGAGSGGGTGGGVYRPGGGVTAPRLLSQVKPSYTVEALGQKVQGSVWLEVVVARDGCVEQVRVIQSLDPGGLDDRAIAAVRRWQFEPGRLGGTPVDVMVTVVMDFSIQ